LDVVYAPSGNAIPRIYFFNQLKTKIGKNTYVGGDWNCVEDITLDVRSKTPLNYPNGGAVHVVLMTMMAEKGLIDERREQLEDSREYTREEDDGCTSTRLDRWYVPADTDLLMTFNVDHTSIFKEKVSDHKCVRMLLDTRKGDLGHERTTIDEELLMESNIQEDTQKIVTDVYASQRSEMNKWTLAHVQIKDLLMKETKARRRASNS
jgi:hypothetical protein